MNKLFVIFFSSLLFLNITSTEAKISIKKNYKRRLKLLKTRKSNKAFNRMQRLYNIFSKLEYNLECNEYGFDFSHDEWLKQKDLYIKYLSKDFSCNVLKEFLSAESGVTTIKRKEEVIVSLTSFPPRMANTWLTIESLMKQTVKPDRIVLTLYKGEFPELKLPWFIQQQMKRGLEINWIDENLKSFKKLSPVIEKYPDAAIITFDDDFVYDKNKINNLFSAYQSNPNCVISSMARVAKYFDKRYNTIRWHNTIEYDRGKHLIPLSGSGTLFPPKSLYKDHNNKDLYSKLCPSDDEIWYYYMTMLNGKETLHLDNCNNNIEITESTATTSLFGENSRNHCANYTKYYRNLFNYYNMENIIGDNVFNRVRYTKKSIKKSNKRKKNRLILY